MDTRTGRKMNEPEFMSHLVQRMESTRMLIRAQGLEVVGLYDTSS